MLVGAEPKADAETPEQAAVEAAASVVEVETTSPAVLVVEPAEEPKAYASKAEWVDFAVSQGVERSDAEKLTKPELIEQFSEGS